jgi:hypothetical protein
MFTNSFIEALSAVAHYSNYWIRTVDSWKPRTHNSRRQFSSLVNHLFAKWTVPTFMDSAWFEGDSEKAKSHQSWFLHLARGENIRTATLPITYTKRMAHFFMQAPAEYSVEAALRYGQILALGGNERLVQEVIATRLGTSFLHDEFWTSVLRFFIDNPLLDSVHVGPIIDYLQNQKFTLQEEMDGMNLRFAVPQPNLTMKGRSPVTLLHQVEAWHRKLPNIKQAHADWLPSNIQKLYFVEGNPESGNHRIWTTTELLSSKALAEEGRLMSHCVATYARSCVHGHCSIWSLEEISRDGRRKVLTLEINRLSKLICQARGKRNARPEQKHLGILRRWSEQAGLSLAAWL